MIISQTIRNGLCIVNKTGSYFQLISASGIVNVTLNLAGRSVLNSKMWVGMNLDKAMPYDEIVITAEQDGAIEFWAGDVSMQLFAFSNDAARAIKTSTKYIKTTTLLTDANYLRKLLRLRASDEIYVGGFGVSQDGWRLTGNEITEIPIAGSVYAYGKPAVIDLSTSAFVQNDANFWDDYGDASNEHRLVLDNGAVKLQKATYLTINTGDGWTTHQQFIGNSKLVALHYSRKRNEVYLLICNGVDTLWLYKSKDNGLTFELFSRVENTEIAVGSSQWGNKAFFEWEDYLTLNSSTYKRAVVFNMNSGYVKEFDFTSWVYFLSLIYIDNDQYYTVGLNSGAANAANIKLQKWTGTTVDDLYTCGGSPKLNLDESGHFCLRDSLIGNWFLTNDFGQNWYESATQVAQSEPFSLPCYVDNGIWLVCDNQSLVALQINGSSVLQTVIGTDPASGSSVDGFYSGNIQFTNDGTVYRSSGSSAAGKYASIYQLTADNLAPVKVEVMELLA
ncbi:hypothetical protein [Shewanella dokdonensis]|uniref:Uncharacterized protein n=1 Tax=Shewanella dokdonensis TaxID=712036 RepID=A0ABX8DEE5_9GAMM|nr:hypothetical protein [Shewanella dokdonensis]MCL1072992.1 hypothetical protein [Shewanella dokdonensis]QVK23093.1 hypothetical protein KHX94_18675 [Shewanella dokdonensis]